MQTTPEAIAAVLVGVGLFAWVMWKVHVEFRKWDASTEESERFYREVFRPFLEQEIAKVERRRDLFRNLKSDGSVWGEDQ